MCQRNLRGAPQTSSADDLHIYSSIRDSIIRHCYRLEVLPVLGLLRADRVLDGWIERTFGMHVEFLRFNAVEAGRHGIAIVLRDRVGLCLPASSGCAFVRERVVCSVKRESSAREGDAELEGQHAHIWSYRIRTSSSAFRTFPPWLGGLEAMD